MTKIIVVGAGVIGLTTAILLQDNGYNVEIVAEKVSPNNTSDVAAAIWEPYIAEPKDLINKWSFETWAVYMQQKDFEGFDRTGIHMVSGYQYYMKPLEQDPEWKVVLPEFRKLTPEEMSKVNKRYVDGRALKTLIIETQKYMPYLMNRFTQRGGIIRSGIKLADFTNEHTKSADIVINCTGIGPATFLGDKETYPVRGCLVKVDAPWVKNFYFEDGDTGSELAYIIPRSDGIACGGTGHRHEWSTTFDDDIARGILERCDRLCPGIKDAPIIGKKAGLRPFRTKVRLEPEIVKSAQYGNKVVIHNYGHGGSGVTVCWGCANSVLKLVNELKNKPVASTSAAPKSRL